ncbi:MAG: sigma-70 family RNA polymerase sigma factor [Nocardioidaceae bacterium]|nr:sigma-70 family RNA polymerase sigma factor [Nocardioidaceae bacterium]MCL2613766.1 sigma-70 family RNA polymerase sigma factor [Nocardioidaceae bacterium]
MARIGSLSHPHDNVSATRRRRLTARLLQRASECEGDERADLIEEVVLLNLSVAETIAARYRDRGLALEDLQQVARAALVRAARQYDVRRDQDFLAYAIPSIRGEVRHYFRDHGWVVRPPRRLQDLRPRVLDERDRQRGDTDGSPTDASVAAALGVPERDVTEAMSTEGCFTPASLDVPLGPETSATLGHLLPDPRAAGDQDAAEARITLQPVLRRLKPRDRKLLQMRFEEEMTQKEIAACFGVTQTQISRLLARVLGDLREALSDEDMSALG